MLSKKLEAAFNKQIEHELYSANLYLSMASYLNSIDMAGASNWMKIQYKEELFHAEKMFDYLMERDVDPVVPAIGEPKRKWNSILEVFEEAYKHEQFITQSIGKLLKLAREENDYAGEVFLQWYINEQVEEESTAKSIVQQLKLVSDSKQALFLLDKDLASRSFTEPK